MQDRRRNRFQNKDEMTGLYAAYFKGRLLGFGIDFSHFHEALPHDAKRILQAPWRHSRTLVGRGVLFERVVLLYSEFGKIAQGSSTGAASQCLHITANTRITKEIRDTRSAIVT